MSGSSKSVQMTKHFTSIKLPLHFLHPESESGTEIADSGFLIIYEKREDSGSRIRIAIPGLHTTRRIKLFPQFVT